MPQFDLRKCSATVVKRMCAQYHAYASSGSVAVYNFAVYENERPVAVFSWSPPPPGAARSVCNTAPETVLALSRMVAVPKSDRRLKHISKPLMAQMKSLIDRTRWPILITYSDESLGHTGYVYKCSGWTPTTRSKRAIHVDSQGRRVSPYSNGAYGQRVTVRKAGTKTIQRWEHWACAPEQIGGWLSDHGWTRVPTGHKWVSGNAAYKIVRADNNAAR